MDPTAVTTRDELEQFVRSLIADLRANGHEWENTTLERYLRALAAVIEDTDDRDTRDGIPAPGQPSWQTFALLLDSAVAYE